MIKISKNHIEILSWADIIYGFYILISSTMGFIWVYFDLVPLPKSDISLQTYLLSLITPLLLLISGYILLKTKKSIKYKQHIGWLSVIFGSFNLINLVVVLFLTFETTKDMIS